MQILPYSYRNPKYRFLTFISKTITPRYIRLIYQMKGRKILFKKGLRDNVAIFSYQAANRVWKFQKSIFVGFLHFSQKIVISRYKRHGYQTKERKILYKKGLYTFFTILSHSVANRVWKVQKSIFDGFWHFSQRIVISLCKRHGYQMKEHSIKFSTINVYLIIGPSHTIKL